VRGDIAQQREIVLHAQEQAMIARDLGDAGVMWSTRTGRESKHHEKREALLERNFGCTNGCDSIYQNAQAVRT
jgi:hypothetical protein